VITTDADYIKMRPPRESEMTRWLAIFNLYCTPSELEIVQQPAKPRRLSTDLSVQTVSIRINKPDATSRLGITLDGDSGFPQITAIAPDALAAKSTLHVGDVLVSVNGAGMNGHEATTQTLRAAVGEVELIVHRDLHVTAQSATATGALESRRVLNLQQGESEGVPTSPKSMGRTFSFRKSSAPAIQASDDSPARGGRLRAADPPQAITGGQSSTFSSIMRRPSFGRSKKTNGEMLTTSSPEISAHNASPPKQVKRRALSFTRSTPTKSEWSNDSSGNASSKANALPPDATVPSQQLKSTKSFGRRMMRRATSFGRSAKDEVVVDRASA
jgi:hypothetical protein